MKKTRKIRVIVKRPQDLVGEIREIDNTLQALQELVGGYIECVRVSSDVVIICNEEGAIEGLPGNCRVCGAMFCGTIVAAGTRGDRFISCPVTLEEWERSYIGPMPSALSFGK